MDGPKKFSNFRNNVQNQDQTSKNKSTNDKFRKSNTNLSSSQQSVSSRDSVVNCKDLNAKPNVSCNQVSNNTIPPLLDGRKIEKFYPVILGNLPNNYLLEDVFDLIAEVEPVAFTEIRRSRVKNIRFCEIYLKKLDNIAYLKRKLNKFIIGGKELFIVEPAQLLTETKWIQ